LDRASKGTYVSFVAKIHWCETARDRNAYITFIRTVYRGNVAYKDSLIPIVRTFLNKSDTFTRSVEIHPLSIREGDRTTAQCMFIVAPCLPILQVGFFDALPNRKADVNLLLLEARRECQRRGLTSVIVGLNGHVAYGVGILTDAFDTPISFDSLYSASYYPCYFSAFEKQTLTVFRFEMAKLRFPPITKTKVSYRTLNMNRFRDDMLLFGDLCNRCLGSTHLYFPRDPMSLYELMSELRPFLKPEHLIFAYLNDTPVGFVLWHPDYNEVLPGGRALSLPEIAARLLLLGHRIKTAKLNAIGVLPEHHRTKLATGLLHEVFYYARSRFTHIESNFVWDNNTASIGLNRCMGGTPYRRYAVYSV
jgi:GNAT superfamily N-acetyltransferase